MNQPCTFEFLRTFAKKILIMFVIKEIEIRDLRSNNGEVEGLPRNPRKISNKQLDELKRSLKDAPEMLRLRELIVVPHGGRFVVIAGNQRLEAAKAVGMETLPCKVLSADTEPAKLREYAIKNVTRAERHAITTEQRKEEHNAE